MLIGKRDDWKAIETSSWRDRRVIIVKEELRD